MLTFGHLLVPLVSYQDENLSNILITTAHLPFEDDRSAAHRGLVHLPTELTYNRLVSHPYAACSIPNIKKTLQAYILSCPRCRIKDLSLGKLRSFTWPSGDPLTTIGLKSIEQAGAFRAISIDICAVPVRPCINYKRSTVTLQVLFAICLDTNFVSFEVLEQAKSHHIVLSKNHL